jgi:uncharacterized protein
MIEQDENRIETVLVTGASAGIGLELARAFAVEGFDLVLVARSGDKLARLAEELEAVHGVEARFLAVDLATDTGPADVFRAVADWGIEIDILVNNAGVGHYAPFAETALDKHLDVVRLNVVATTALTGLFVPPMVERGYGRVMNVASVAAFQPTPMIALYGATKAFILSLTEALSVELEGTGVTATALCPGFTGTEMIENLATQAGDPQMIPDALLLDPVTVAREGVAACLEGTTVHINGLGYRLGVLWESWHPRWLIRTMGAAVSRAMRPAPR